MKVLYNWYERMLIKVCKFSRKFSHLSSKMAKVSPTLYIWREKFVTRTNVYFWILEMWFDFKAHLYAHNLVKKCAINHVLSIKLCSSYSSPGGNKIEEYRKHVSKENCNLWILYKMIENALSILCIRPESKSPCYIIPVAN